MLFPVKCFLHDRWIFLVTIFYIGREAHPLPSDNIRYSDVILPDLFLFGILHYRCPSSFFLCFYLSGKFLCFFSCMKSLSHGGGVIPLFPPVIICFVWLFAWGGKRLCSIFTWTILYDFYRMSSQARYAFSPDMSICFEPHSVCCHSNENAVVFMLRSGRLLSCPEDRCDNFTPF